jgi:hypothetical protein
MLENSVSFVQLSLPSEKEPGCFKVVHKIKSQVLHQDFARNARPARQTNRIDRAMLRMLPCPVDCPGRNQGLLKSVAAIEFEI